MGEAGDRAARPVAQGRRAGAFRHDHARGLWRRRRRFPLQRHHDRGAGPRAGVGSGLLAAQRHRGSLPAPLRHRGAEEEVDPEGLLRRTGHGHRHDRAGDGLRPAGDQDDGRHGRQRVGHQRLQDLHLQRPARRPRDRGRQDRSQARRQGHVADRRRDEDRGLQARPQSREDRDEGAGHVRAVLPGRARAGGSSAGRAGHGLRAADAAAPSGTPGHRHPGGGGDRGGAGTYARLREGAQGVREADHRFPEHALQAGRTQDQGPYRPRLRRRLRGQAPQGRTRRRDRGDGQVLDERAAMRVD